MADGNDFEQLLHQAIDDAIYISDVYPKMAKRIWRLVAIIRTYDRNQKALIRLTLELRRANKSLSKMIRRMFHLMTKGQRNIIDIWLKAGDDE